MGLLRRPGWHSDELPEGLQVFPTYTTSEQVILDLGRLGRSQLIGQNRSKLVFVEMGQLNEFPKQLYLFTLGQGARSFRHSRDK